MYYFTMIAKSKPSTPYCR